MSIKLLAPNGKQSNLNAEQYELVRSPAFKKWFGDWENDFNENMLIDKNGEPMIWFHTGGDWTKLNDDGINGKGKLMFSPTKSSMAYGRDGEQTITRPFFIKSDFIYKLPYEDRNTSSAYRWNKNKKNPIWFVNAYGGFVVVRQSNQIKLADGTNTMFDINSDDIRYVKGGKVNGDCYLVAGQMAMKIYDKKIDYIGTPYLVHAEVKHSKIENLRYGHAFIEDDENVYDFSNNRKIIMPKEIYYYFGDINPRDKKKYKKYNFKQAREKMLSTGNYGCWDIKVDFSNGGKIVNGRINEMPNYLKIILGFSTAGQI